MSESDQSAIEDLSPSAKLVYTVLDHRGSQTQKQIIEESMLSPRTVRYALGDLADAGAVTERVYLQDARQSLYELTEGDPEQSGDATGERSRSTHAGATDD
jgi:DNA-binding MarR family transcriptional regulator